MRRSQTIAVVFVVTCVLSATPRADAKVRIGSFCTISGMRELHLVGMGIVTGLNGSGDSAKSAPAMRPLAQALNLMHMPAKDLKELSSVKNVALVKVEAVIPRHGVRAGQRIDVIVSSVMDAASLRGGRLWAAPLEDSAVKKPGNAIVSYGVASGRIIIEDPKFSTVGKIPGGLVVSKDVIRGFVSRHGDVTVLLDRSHSGFNSANEVAQAINEEFRIESGSNIAKAISPVGVRVLIPASYAKSPVEFVAHVLDVGVDQPNIEARVIVNAKTGVVIVSGEVEVSPVIIASQGLKINTQGTSGGTQAGGGDAFVPITDRQNKQSTQSLRDLIEAFRELQVPTADIIKILRELHASGKLHAKFEER